MDEWLSRLTVRSMEEVRCTIRVELLRCRNLTSRTAPDFKVDMAVHALLICRGRRGPRGRPRYALVCPWSWTTGVAIPLGSRVRPRGPMALGIGANYECTLCIDYCSGPDCLVSGLALGMRWTAIAPLATQSSYLAFILVHTRCLRFDPI
ncbi:hypothetical protein EV127DRAFT_119554 [Xylaria flabelliformis]|nr:hypothetical protein EV127DRAFT_119554 [Xylaria flabelliformis]